MGHGSVDSSLAIQETNEVVAIRQGRVASTLAARELSLLTAQLDAEPVA